MENKSLQNEHHIESGLVPSGGPELYPAASAEGLDGSGGKVPTPEDSPGSDSPADGIPQKSKGPKSRDKKKPKSSDAASSSVPVRHWFVTLMCMNIPIIGWIYLAVLACSRSKGPRRDFAKAYLLYKLVFLLLSLAILAVALHYGLELLDKVLAYMEML